MSQRYYAGIGSRRTPNDIKELMTSIAKQLATYGYTLRSGGAVGADSAFAMGAHLQEIFTVNSPIPSIAFDIAKGHHPAWENCNGYVRKLHARNAMIILGADLKTPVDFVLYWTVTGEAIGGTGLGLRIAKTFNIKTFSVDYKLLSSAAIEHYMKELHGE